MAKQNNQSTDIVVFEQQIDSTEQQFSALAARAKAQLQFAQERQFALDRVRSDVQLQRCKPDSLREAFQNLAAMGLSLNPAKQQAALVARWSKKEGGLVATAMPMYRGYIALATSGRAIKNVWGGLVLEGDEIQIEQGSAPKIKHVPKIRRKGESGKPTPENVIGAYVVAEIADSAHPHITWVGIDEILAVAERSESYNPRPRQDQSGKVYTPAPSGPWVTDFGQMCVKTAFRRAYKTWPGVHSDDYVGLQAAVHIENQAEADDNYGETPPAGEQQPQQQASAELVLTDEQVKELTELCVQAKIRPARLAAAYGVDKLEAMPSSKYDEAKSRVAAKVRTAA